MKKVHVIINPASGKAVPILRPLHDVFTEHNVEWDVSLTRKGQEDITAPALASSADVIAVCGGDGTVSQAAHELAGKNRVMAILPAGTANVLAAELDIPGNIRDAAELICKGGARRKVDMGKVNGRYFILRAGFGFEAEFVSKTEAVSKSYLGRLAYFLSGIRALIDTKPAVYQMSIDGKDLEREGLSLIITNSGNLGMPGVKLLPEVDISDGYLDVILVRPADLRKIFPAGGNDSGEPDENAGFFAHWKAERVKVSASSRQAAHLDGEPFETDTMDVRVHPGAVEIVAPASREG